LASPLLHASDQPNLAPLSGLESARAQYDPQCEEVADFLKWWKECEKKFKSENAAEWASAHTEWSLIYLFIEGKQVLNRDKRSGGWRFVGLPDRTDSPVHAYNLVGFYSRNIKAKWTQSATDVIIRAARDTDEAQGAARAAQTVVDHYERLLFPETFKQNEAGLAQCGKYARYFYYSDEAEGGYARREITEQQQVKFGEDAALCADCGWMGSAGELPGQPIAGGAGGLGQQPADSPGLPSGSGGDDMLPAQLGPTGAPVGAEPPLEGEPIRPIPGAPQDIASAQAGGLQAGLAPSPPEEVPQPGAGAQVPAPACPQCGSPNVVVTPATEETLEVVTGHEDIKLGDICVESVPAFELTHDIGCSPEDSDWLHRERRIRTAKLQSVFPGLKIKSTEPESSGLKAEEALKRSAGNQGGGRQGDSGKGEFSTFHQWWLAPCLYENKVLKQEIQAATGEVIPAGTRLGEVFPDGLYLALVDGVEGPVDVRNESHRDHWVGGVYHTKPMSGLGMGIGDMIEGQRQYNLVMSMIYTVLRTCASPATLYDQRLLPNGTSQYLGNPLKSIPVDLSRMPEGFHLSNAVHQLAPKPPAGEYFNYAQQLDYHLQKTSDVTDFSGGLPGVNNETATGANIAAANSQSLFAPMLANKAEVDRRSALKIIQLYKRHMADERYLSISGRRAEQDGVWLKGADLTTDIIAEVRPESYLPQTNLERRERLGGFLEMVGALGGLPVALSEFPGFTEKISEAFDIDLGGDDYSAAGELCRQRVEQMKKVLPQAQEYAAMLPPSEPVVDPMTGMPAVDPMTGMPVEQPIDPVAEAGAVLVEALVPKPSVKEMGHEAAVNWLRDWITTDDGLNAPPELRAGVEALIDFHLEAMAQEMLVRGGIEAAGAVPGMQPGMEEGGGAPPPKKDKPNGAKQAKPKPAPGAKKASQPVGAK